MQPLILLSVFCLLTAINIPQKCQCKHWSSQCSWRKWDRLFCSVKLYTNYRILQNTTAFCAVPAYPNFSNKWSVVDLFHTFCISKCFRNAEQTLVRIILCIRLHSKYMLLYVECHFKIIWTDAVLAVPSNMHHIIYQ